jgi:mono/diheme cytochrome c family protein
VIAAAVVIFCCLPLRRSLGDDAAPAPKLVPGLTLSFQNAKGETVDARDARLVALMVPAGTPASPMLDVGPWQATWTGVVNTKIKDTYRFAAEGRGDLSVTLNDKPLMELHGDLANHPTDPVQLKKGKNRIVVIYHSPADGDAKIRLLWAASDKPMEPISPIFFTHDAGDDRLVKQASLRTGRELVASMRCAACHRGIDGNMPELKQDAPDLTDLKSRVNFTWAAYWISNPKALRPMAEMPRIFHDAPAGDQPVVDDRAGDIAAYLTTADTPVTPVSDPQILARGARLFTGLGCVACHIGPGVADSDPTLNRIPLKYVRAKFKPAALVEFLHKPEAHFAWIKMPNFHLSDVEANSIASWLLASCAPDALPPIGKTFNADNGRKLFESSGCTNCHSIGGSKATSPSATDFAHAEFTRGCMADDAMQIQKGVDFGFTTDQRAAVRAFMAADWKPALQRDPLPEFTARQISALRCIACHKIDAQDNIWSNLDTEIGTIEQNLPPRADNDPEPKGDQSRPPLTWTGEKLQPTWMSDFIAGKIAYKPRQWLFARMPAFTSRAQLISQGLALSHGCPTTDETRPAVDDKLAEIGKQLTSQTGLGCVKCHAVADQAALAPFEAEAPNFAHVEARLRHDYFTHWMRNPQYYLPGTKMPSFADVNGQTPLKDVLNGDAAAEFDAVWNYLRAGEKIVPVQ